MGLEVEVRMRGGSTVAAAVAATVALTVWASAAGAAPRITARAAIIMNAASGEVLWESNANQPLPPASTTKILTAILAIESGRLDDEFRVSTFAAETAPSKINLLPGQRMRLEHLLYAVLLNSANDAAEVVAEGLAGTQAAFAERMTERAHALGATTAHFMNPHGLTAPGHVASAHDLAVLFRHGMKLPLFREILATRTIEVPITAASVRHITLRSHNRLLSGYSYPVIGKTGYTQPARRCFVGAASGEDREIIVALLGASDLWGDARRLIEYGLGAADKRAPVMMAGVVPTIGRRRAKQVASEGDDGAVSDHPATEAARYAVQIGPYRNRRTAEAARARLARNGYAALVTGRAIHIGRFDSRKGAVRVAARLRVSGYHPTIVALR
jgi:D-alanyl-D-alanine carboxypeptidase (penicillin-binding protein 5/6)